MTGSALIFDAARVAAEIEPSELNRVLGMPRNRPLEGLLAERADWARSWYAEHGRPYVRAHRHDLARLEADVVVLGAGHEFPSRALADHLRRFEAHAVVAMAVSAGSEVDQASDEMWKDGRPDEGYFIERLGVAVVERLIFSITLHLCQLAESRNETLTPHLSPGCGTWELQHQRILWDAIFPAGELGPIRLLESGGLSPKNSVLAAAGITRRPVTHSPLDACRSCHLERCTFRRAPYLPTP